MHADNPIVRVSSWCSCSNWHQSKYEQSACERIVDNANLFLHQIVFQLIEVDGAHYILSVFRHSSCRFIIILCTIERLFRKKYISSGNKRECKVEGKITVISGRDKHLPSVWSPFYVLFFKHMYTQPPPILLVLLPSLIFDPAVMPCSITMFQTNDSMCVLKGSSIHTFVNISRAKGQKTRELVPFACWICVRCDFIAKENRSRCA